LDFDSGFPAIWLPSKELLDDGAAAELADRETKARMILQFIDGLRGNLNVTFEEGTSAAWLYDLLKPHVTNLVVCDPRKNKSMREGNQNDKIDARRLAELLRLIISARSITSHTRP
jgi:transposase